MKLNMSAMEKASFIERINRFVIRASKENSVTNIYLPNPGRLWELLIPNATIYILPAKKQNRLPYTAIAVEKNGIPIMIHTHFTNFIVEDLIKEGRIADFSGYDVVKREVTIGNSRIDFLLKKGNKQVFLEVKTCTLFGEKLAMFPDAETSRGRRHLRELQKLSDKTSKSGVLFVIQCPYSKYFMPEVHIDVEFAKTLLEVRNSIFVKAISVGYDVHNSFKVNSIRDVEIPWNVVPHYVQNSGCYLLILEVQQGKKLKIGSLGDLDFEPGYYVYVGRAKKNLKQRIAHHKRRIKKPHWHIDYLASISSKVQALPLRLPDAPECEIASHLNTIFRPIKNFGSSDCNCESHLFYSVHKPIQNPKFVDMLIYFRITRIEETLP